MIDPSLADFRARASLEMGAARRMVAVPPRPVVLALLGLLSLGGTPGCTYRFTNAHVSRPAGIHSIAVEAIYDTSREVIPHEILWESLQNALAADGHLVLAAQGRADALLRAHIKTASVLPAGGNSNLDTNSDLSVKTKDPNPLTAGEPPSPKDFLKLGQTGSYQALGQINLVCDVEVVDLNTRAVLLKKTYQMAAVFQGVHSSSDLPSTSLANDYLRYDESMRAQFKTLSNNVADAVVSDLLAR